MNSLLFITLLGFVLGVALQITTPSLSSLTVYIVALSLAGACALLKFFTPKSRLNRRGALLLLIVPVMLLGWSFAGVRAHLRLDSQLQADLEGQNLRVTGVVAAMPQFHDAGVRFVLDVEQAQLLDQQVAVPPNILLGWYGGSWTGPEVLSDLQPKPMAIHAGERWQFTVRLKAPHGNLNPHGFDYELWLWEQGIQATGYVRAGAQDAAPRRMDTTWLHPVEWARQHVRDAVLKRGQQDTWGVVAALVVGDQRAIDRAQWEVFRITGVAHLMSISGLHIT
jgi:competence protein ComEC